VGTALSAAATGSSTIMSDVPSGPLQNLYTVLNQKQQILDAK